MFLEVLGSVARVRAVNASEDRRDELEALFLRRLTEAFHFIGRPLPPPRFRAS